MNNNLPLISYVVAAFNQEQFVQEAIESAFAQTYSPLEIILSDDCSVDNTFKIMNQMAQSYDGKHTVVVNRNERNMGLVEHVNILTSMARGELIVLAAGDDISMPERCMRSQQFFEKNKDHYCISFDTVKFTNNEYKHFGKEVGRKPQIHSYALADLISDSTLHTNGASRTIRKSVMTDFPALLSSTPSEDSTILLRCLILGRAAQIKEPMVYYRIHGNNMYASDKKYMINYNAIYDQYIADINHALENRLLDAQSAARLSGALLKRLERNTIMCEFGNEKNKAKVFLLRVLPSRAFRLKQKYRYFKRVLDSLGV